MKPLVSPEIIVKLGSSFFLPQNNDCCDSVIREIVKISAEKGIMGVNSGAIATAATLLNKPYEQINKAWIPYKQALASFGQHQVMGRLEKIVNNENPQYHVGQILLTYYDLDSKRARENIRNTISEQLIESIIPFVNENDVTATEEIRIGDNDPLAAMVAKMVKTKLLIILTDVKGLFDEKGQVIPKVEKITPQIEGLAKKSSNSEFGSGGMLTKVEAAKKATQNGIKTIIGSWEEPDILLRIMEGESVGTKFLPQRR